MPVIVLAQIGGVSVWFASNAVVPDLEHAWGAGSVAWVTGAVQLGFVLGTLLSTVTGLADRVSPRWLFLASTIACGLANIAVIPVADNLMAVLLLRFLVGVGLAGVYPIGMKIAAGWYERGLGRALGWLVGALVLGTASPHLMRGLGSSLPWTGVFIGTSAACLAGGVLLAIMVPDGPFLKPGGAFSWSAAVDIARRPALRRASFAYFGHMWELYTFWAFVPVALGAWALQRSVDLSVPLWSAAVVSIGAVGCVIGGLLAARWGSDKVAGLSLLVSGACCLVAPLMLDTPAWLFLPWMLLWGLAVISDSPQLSTMTAQAAPPALVGSALTLVNGLGFALTIVSLQVARLIDEPKWLLFSLAVGPMIGLVALLVRRSRDDSSTESTHQGPEAVAPPAPPR
ncbi:MAG: MFS family permease [Kiritimatiellia bacterium]